MALAACRYNPNYNPPEENRQGYVFYDGNAYDFSHWMFRTDTAMITCDEKDKKKTLGNIIQCLRGDALQVAIDLDQTKLLADDGSGAKLLTDAISKSIWPLRDEEAKVLYREFHKVGGHLARQRGEPMTGYINRRTRSVTILKTLDEKFEMADDMLGDFLLDNAGLNDTQKLLILTSTGNKKEKQEIETALMKQHAKIHYTCLLYTSPSPRDP